MVLPHHHQTKKSEYPKAKKLSSPGEIVHFFVFGHNKILKLMDVWRYPMSINSRNFNTSKYQKVLFVSNKLD
ncbi:hypothetical protein CN491_02480 [Bacillus cereus]|uniref:Uncharacterized protein n=1 Tax=Bacillus cereus TaxID=1396 RepID=A0A2A8LV61_BACCE|nr:hypothetical protein CN491_02480 [Bacillus cereus]PFP67405.1 hypothetical protein COJ95_26330 [Bacillus cereus]